MVQLGEHTDLGIPILANHNKTNLSFFASLLMVWASTLGFGSRAAIGGAAKTGCKEHKESWPKLVLKKTKPWRLIQGASSPRLPK